MTRLLAALILGAFTATLLVLVGMSRRGVVGPVRFVEPPNGWRDLEMVDFA